MARLKDKIANANARATSGDFAAEVAELKKKTRFDRVSEDHQPWGAAFHTAKSPLSPPDETLPVDNER